MDEIRYITYGIKNIVKNVHGWLSNDEGRLLFLIARYGLGKGVIVEIGSWQGKSTIWLAYGTKVGNREKVYAVDPHTSNPFDEKVMKEIKKLGASSERKFRKNIKMANVDDKVVPLVTTSKRASKKFDEPVRFLFIDGIHEYDYVRTDWECWSPKLIDGGIVAFDDSTMPGVKMVINEFVLGPGKYKYLGKIGMIRFFIKPGEINKFRLASFILFLKTIRRFIKIKAKLLKTKGKNNY